MGLRWMRYVVFWWRDAWWSGTGGDWGGSSGPAFAGALGWRGDGWGRASAPATTRHHDLDLCVLQNTAFDAGR
jgi:hypothetical protein